MTDPPLGTPPPPTWLAEIMAELGVRFGLNTTGGLSGAESAALRFSDDLGYKCRACAALARGYHHSRLALVYRELDPNGEAYARENEHAGSAFCEGVELAHRGEKVAA